MRTTFASDNFSTVHPEVMKALHDANVGHQPSYGEDEYTARATELFKKHFGDGLQVCYFTTGTAANVFALSLLLTRSYESVLVPATAHTFSDEVGAPQAALGAQLLPVATQDGKLTVMALQQELEARLDLDYHSTLPKVVSIAQVTEYGTVYSVEEVRAIAGWCHANDMYLHMDGCRLPNAAVALGVDFKTVTRDAGVDVLSFGGAKNGLMNAEAVVVFNAPKSSLPRIQKQLLQLSSKMRYVSAQFIPYLSTDVWRTNAETANKLAQALGDGLTKINGVTLTQKTEANQVFMSMPKALKDKLHAAGHIFYDWDLTKGEVRFVAAWDNTAQDVEQLLADAKQPAASTVRIPAA